MNRLAVFLAGLAIPSVVAAQVVPQPIEATPAIHAVSYAEGQVVYLSAAPGYLLTVELSPDERIENIAVGDSTAWQVTANKRGDRLFIRSLQSGVTTNMTVVTSTRLYLFELAPSYSQGSMSGQVVRFAYPQPFETSGVPDELNVEQGLYKLSGTRALFPSAISEDGIRTYMEWSPDAVLPAVYALNELGQEKLIDAMMRNGILTIDDVVPRLVFRLDGKTARAERRSEAKVK